jgi:hypothetical protein
MPMQTGQTWVLGSSPLYSAEQRQNIFERVRTWEWHSRPITVS